MTAIEKKVPGSTRRSFLLYGVLKSASVVPALLQCSPVPCSDDIVINVAGAAPMLRSSDSIVGTKERMLVVGVISPEFVVVVCLRRGCVEQVADRCHFFWYGEASVLLPAYLKQIDGRTLLCIMHRHLNSRTGRR